MRRAILRHLALAAALAVLASAQAPPMPYKQKFPGDPARSEPEASALGYMRTVLYAQREYKKKKGRYAGSLYALVGSGSFTKRMTKTDRGDYDVSFSGGGGGFGLTLAPKQFDSAHRAFYTDASGVIRAEDEKPATADSPVLKEEHSESQPAKPISTDPLRSREQISPYGIFAGETVVVLFGGITPDVCYPEPFSSWSQLLISEDGGVTWTKRGPLLGGSIFEWVLENQHGIWVAGEHTAEGPASAPFVLVPTGPTFPDWNHSLIYDGASDLVKVGFESEKLIAWMRHLQLTEEGWSGPIYQHTSEDLGQHWSESGPLTARVDDESNLLPFQLIGVKHGDWRLIEQGEGGIEVQHHDDAGSEWHTVSVFPRQLCSESDTRSMARRSSP